MDFTAICRTCMKNNNLYPIFASEENHEKYSSAIYLCTGIEINLNDDLPQNMCVVCMKQVNNILKFRKQCKEVETQLYKLKNDETKHFSSISNTKNCQNDNMKHLLTVNCSNITEIKDESNIKDEIKTEPSEKDFDENQPIKVFIQKHTFNNPLLKSNKFKNILTKTENSEDLNEEKFVKHFLNTDEASCDYDSASDDTADSKPITMIYSKVSHNLNDAEDSNDNQLYSLPESSLTEISSEITNVPYNVVSESVTKATRVVCKICQKELSIRSIDTHMARRHPGADERKVKCELCDKYVMKEKMNRHRLMAHGSAGFRCGYCKSEFKTKEILVEHVATCGAKKRKRKTNDTGRAMAECDVCHKTMQRASLKMHKAVKHAGLRPVCEHCGISFGNKFRLNEHYRAKHGYEKFQCTYCDFKSAGIMAMRNHERRHRGEKPFVCESCGAKFHAAYLLTQHKHSHRTEKLVKCDLCPASFKANNSLHMHKLTCHSKSLYKCTICTRSYKCRYYAVKHARLTHSATGTPPVIKLMT